MYRASLGFPRAMAVSAASRADTECLPGNQDATKSVPSKQFPAASEASRVIVTSGMEPISGASGGGPGTHVQHFPELHLNLVAQWAGLPATPQESSTCLPKQTPLKHPGHCPH